MDFHIGEHWVVNILGLNVHMDTLITMWTVMLLIILLSLIAVLNLKLIPNKFQAAFENIVSIFVGMTKNLGGMKAANATLLMCIFLFIILGNMIGQLPWKLIHLPKGEFASPTNDINVTAALAVIVLIYYIMQGIVEKGPSYFKHYFKPMLFMTPFNILEDFTRPLTLAVRLFANILAGEILIMVLGGLVFMLLTPEAVLSFTQNVLHGFLPESWVYNIGLFFGSLLPLPIMFFELFVAFIQALVFTLLTCAYIETATAKNH